MSEPTDRFCTGCGAAIAKGSRFCERCGKAAVPAAAERIATGPTGSLPTGRGRKVLLAMGIVAAVATGIGIWVAKTIDTSVPPKKPGEASDPFPVNPDGIDSINNTIDGRKVAIEGDGHVMQSPGLGVNRPVWVLVGPAETVFTVPVGMAEGDGVFAPRLQVLLPVLREEQGSPKEASLRLTLIDAAGRTASTDHRVKGENRWQRIDGRFAYASASAPYRLRVEATGFKGAIYFDQIVSAPAAPSQAEQP